MEEELKCMRRSDLMSDKNQIWILILNLISDLDSDLICDISWYFLLPCLDQDQDASDHEPQLEWMAERRIQHCDVEAFWYPCNAHSLQCYCLQRIDFKSWWGPTCDVQPPSTSPSPPSAVPSWPPHQPRGMSEAVSHWLLDKKLHRDILKKILFFWFLRMNWSLHCRLSKLSCIVCRQTPHRLVHKYEWR